MSGTRIWVLQTFGQILLNRLVLL